MVQFMWTDMVHWHAPCGLRAYGVCGPCLATARTRSDGGSDDERATYALDLGDDADDVVEDGIGEEI